MLKHFILFFTLSILSSCVNDTKTETSTSERLLQKLEKSLDDYSKKNNEEKILLQEVEKMLKEKEVKEMEILRIAYRKLESNEESDYTLPLEIIASSNLKFYHVVNGKVTLVRNLGEEKDSVYIYQQVQKLKESGKGIEVKNGNFSFNIYLDHSASLEKIMELNRNK